MPVRMTGMASGLDTETLIKGMMDAQRMKNKKVSDKSQILEWKQERLKEVNAKLYKLYAEDLTKLKMQGAYNTKKVSSSNENVVSVTGNTSATNGTHSLSNIKLASSQFLTGDPITLIDGKAPTSSTSLKDLGIADGTLITIETKDGKRTFDVKEESTISEFVQFAKNSGINASYDTTQNRFFLSSKNSGENSWFSITSHTDTETAMNARRAIDKAIGYSNLSLDEQSKVNDAYNTLKDKDITDKTVATSFLQNLAEKKEATDKATAKIKSDITAAIENGTELKGIVSATAKEDIKKSAEAKVRKDNNIPADALLTPEQQTKVDEYTANAIANKIESDLRGTVAKSLITTEKNRIIDAKETTVNLSTDMDAYAVTTVSDPTGRLNNLNINEVKVGEDGKVKSAYDKDGNTIPSPKNFINAGDSSVTYNGVELKSATNTITVNGLTINIKGTTTETINMTVSNDTKSIFDSVKKFVTNYNAIIKEMNELYYAGSAREYAPLSDDEKDAMTDGQIEKWEKKIKDSMLRRDSAIGNVLSGMKQAVMTSVKGSDGKTYSLASLGIGTSSDYTEKGLLHINGDPEDPGYSILTDKLTNMLNTNPDLVAEIMSKTMDNLYKDIDSKIKAIPNVRSAFTFYNDKSMTTQQTTYKKKIAELEKKLTTLETKYYKQFAAMEKAMANLQSQSNSLTSMLGGSSK